MSDEKPEAMTQHRAGDPGTVKITREIPLWGIVTAIAAFVLQSIVSWQGQIRSNEMLGNMVVELKDARAEIRELAAKVGTSNIKDVEHDMTLRDMERRLSNLEGSKK